MIDLDSTFAKLLGRQPSDRERQNLYRVKDALDLQDNDALWAILLALETYDTMFRKYPEMVATRVTQTVDEVRVLMAEIAETESQKALGALADAVARTGERLASRSVNIWRWQIMGMVWLGFTAFGALCVLVGAVLASGHLPYWAIPAANQNFAQTLLGVIARTPAGWLAALGGCTATAMTAWRIRNETSRAEVAALVCGAVFLGLSTSLMLWPVFIT